VAKVLESVLPSSPESRLDLTLASAVLKGDKFDLVVQKAVELGVSRIVPLLTVRCDVKLKDPEKRIDRWRKIALEASKQSGRAKWMKVEEPKRFDQFIKAGTNAETIMFSERGGSPFPAELSGNTMTAIVGPEGGWDDSELAVADREGVRIVTMGGRILRAETAAISIAAILQFQLGDLN
jgi:16S rRNA (uracil1498-N3)-methyltransferase